MTAWRQVCRTWTGWVFYSVGFFRQDSELSVAKQDRSQNESISKGASGLYTHNQRLRESKMSICEGNSLESQQGDQIGRIFAQSVFVCCEQLHENCWSSPHFWATLFIGWVNELV
jgi:hypothetical protein